MLFVGAIPREVISQALAVTPLPESGDIYCCCSGSFRLEQALRERRPGLRLHSNDVSLFSTAIGSLAAGKPLDWEFHSRLEFLERFGKTDPVERLAALMVALRMSHFSGKSEHAQRHFEHYVANANQYVALAKSKAEPYLAALKISSFSACDFRDHGEKAIESGSWLVAWPPTYKSGYENLYRLINKNTKWTEPNYRVFDPADLPKWLDELDAKGAKYVVCADHQLEGRTAHASFSKARARTIWLYSSGATSSSVRRDSGARQPVQYEPVVASALTAETPIELRVVGSGPMNFLKDKYLATGLEHSDGSLRFVVLLDGKVAGGFIYSPPSFGGPSDVYLLCDFSTSRERRLAKLMAMLAASGEPIAVWERKRFIKVKRVVTTAFTKKPVSMKYRGIYELIGRKESFLNYASEVRREPIQKIYAEWWRRFGKAG